MQHGDWRKALQEQVPLSIDLHQVQINFFWQGQDLPFDFQDKKARETAAQLLGNGLSLSLTHFGRFSVPLGVLEFLGVGVGSLPISR